MKQDPYELMSSKENNKSPCLFTLIDEKRATWEMTGTCNLGCKHCCIDASSKKDKTDLTIDKAKAVNEEMSEENVRAIYISGGEPLMWKETPEYIKNAKRSGIKHISLATNGVYVNSESARILKDSGVDKVLISLDSHREDVHDDFRGVKGVYKSAVNAIEQLSKQDVFVRIGTVIWSENVDELEELTSAMYSMGANEIAFSWLMKSGRAVEHPEIFVPKERYFEVGNRLSKLKNTWKQKLLISYHRFNPIDDSFIDCQGGARFLHINPEGHLSPCSWITKLAPQYISENTIFFRSLSSLMEDEHLKNFRSVVANREARYGPGCPAVCLIENGSLNTKDPLYHGNKSEI